jgi:hypothetical protein
LCRGGMGHRLMWEKKKKDGKEEKDQASKSFPCHTALFAI